MIRTSRRLALAALAVLLLAGCGDSPARAGAAAVVGDERIATEDLQQIVDRGLADPAAEQQFGSDRAGYQRQVLSRLVRGVLLEEAASEQGLDVTQGDVDAQLAEFVEQAGGREELEQQAAAGGVGAQDLPRFARDVVLELRLGDELTRDLEVAQPELDAIYQQSLGQYQQARSRHILVENEAQARDLLAQLQADPSAFAALAAQFSTDTSNKDQGGDLGLQGRGTFVPEFDEAVFTTPLNTPVVVQTQFGWHVIEVLERRTTEQAEVEDELRRRALGDQRTERVEELLRETAERVGVQVNPRFGRWDADAVEVTEVPADDGLSSPPSDGTGAGGGTGGTGGTTEELETPAPTASP